MARVLCGAKTRNKKTCRHTAGERTTHPGQGKCWMHGGTREGDPRVKSGRYSKVQHPRLRELVEQLGEDANPLDLLDDIVMMRALFVHFIERHAAFTDALLAWHADWQLRRRPLPEDLLIAFEAVVTEREIALTELGEDASSGAIDDVGAARLFITFLRTPEELAKPRQLLDISDAHKILADVGRLVERVENLRSANAISRPELNRLFTAMGRVVELTITPAAIAKYSADDIKERIRERWMDIGG